MDKGTQEKVNVPREPKSWQEWYSTTRDIWIKMQASLKTNLALQEKNEAFMRTNDVAKLGSWITGSQDDIITLLEVLDWLQNRVSTLEGENSAIKTSLDERDAKITRTLELILEWKKESQGTLDRAREYFAGLVDRPQRGGGSGR